MRICLFIYTIEQLTEIMNEMKHICDNSETNKRKSHKLMEKEIMCTRSKVVWIRRDGPSFYFGIIWWPLFLSLYNQYSHINTTHFHLKYPPHRQGRGDLKTYYLLLIGNLYASTVPWASNFFFIPMYSIHPLPSELKDEAVSNRCHMYFPLTLVDDGCM